MMLRIVGLASILAVFELSACASEGGSGSDLWPAENVCDLTTLQDVFANPSDAIGKRFCGRLYKGSGRANFLFDRASESHDAHGLALVVTTDQNPELLAPGYYLVKGTIFLDERCWFPTEGRINQCVPVEKPVELRDLVIFRDR